MAMLKTITPKPIDAGDARSAMEAYIAGGGQTRKVFNKMRRYLIHGNKGVENRSLAHADSDNMFIPPGRTWADAMVSTKAGYCKLGGRPYYHFIISPDPDDRISPEECLEVAAEWVRRRYPESQWHIDVHDDNTKRITHAHVIVNSVLPDSGKKIHISKQDVKLDARALQDICRERGLGTLPDLDELAAWQRRGGERADRARATTAAHSVESDMRNKGRTSWRSVVRDSVDKAAARSSSWEDFVNTLSESGVTAIERKRGVTFRLEDFQGDGPRTIKGSTLGRAYTKSCILKRLFVDWDGILGVAVDGWGRPASGPHKIHFEQRDHGKDEVALRTRMAKHDIEKTYAWKVAERAGRCAHWRRLDGLIDAIRTLDDVGIGSRHELDQLVALLADDVASLEADIERHERGIDRALEIAERAQRVRDDRAWVGAMQERRIWKPSERRETRMREQRIAEDSDWCAQELSGAKAWLDALGIDKDDYYRRASALVDDLRRSTEVLRGRLEQVRERHGRVAQAQGVLIAMYPEPEPLLPKRMTRPGGSMGALKGKGSSMGKLSKGKGSSMGALKGKGSSMGRLSKGKAAKDGMVPNLTSEQWKKFALDVGRMLGGPETYRAQSMAELAAGEAERAAVSRGFVEKALGGTRIAGDDGGAPAVPAPRLPWRI